MRKNPSSPGTESLVSAAAGLYGLGVLALVAPMIKPDFRWNGDVVNEAVIQAYPKQQESLIYLLALVLIPVICLLGHVLWNRLSGENEKLRDLDAAAHLPLLGWIGGYLTGVGSALVWLIGSALVHIGLRVAVHIRFVSWKSHHARKSGSPLSDTSETYQTTRDTAPAGSRCERGHHGSPAPGLAIAWGIVILAGVATGLSLAAMVSLGDTASKARSIVGALLGVVGFTILWHIISWIALRIRQTEADKMRMRIGISFLPFCILLLHAFPSSRATFPLPLELIAILCSVIWISIVLAGNNVLLRGMGSLPTRRPFVELPRTFRTLFWWLVVPAALYALAYIHDIQAPPDLYHEGERIVPAAAISKGATPYRDVFIWHGLYENGIKGQIAFSLFGESVTGMRLFDRLVEPVGAGVFFLLCWACLGHPLRGLLSVLLYLLLFSPPNVRYLLPYAGFAVLAVWLRRRDERALPLVVAGGLSGSAVFFSLDGGMGAVLSMLILIVLVAIAWEAKGNTTRVTRLLRNVGLVLGGTAVGAVLPLAWLAARDALPAFLRTSFAIIWGLSDRSSQPYVDLLGMTKELGVIGGLSSPLGSKIFASYLPPLVIVWGVAHLITRGWRKSSPVATTTLAVPLVGALVFFRAVIRRPDADHLTKLMPLLYLVLVLLLWFHAHHVLVWFRSGRQRWFRLMGPVMMVLSCVGVLYVLAWQELETAPALRLEATRHEDASRDRVKGTRRVELDKAGDAVATASPEAIWLEDVVGFVVKNSEPGETFYDFTNKGLFYFLTDRPCPTRYPQTTYAATRAAQREVIADLKKTEPKLVLFPSGDPGNYGYDRLIHPFRHPLITRYLYRAYQPVRVIDDLLILKRKGVKGLPRARGVNRFLADAPFHANLKHLPRLLGERPEPMTIVRKWDADILARQWGTPRNPGATGDLQNGTFLLPTSSALSSPKLRIDPRPVDAVVICLAAEHDGRVRFQFRSADQPAYGRQGQVDFTVKGDGHFHDYRIEVGLLPSWIWRGPIAGLRLHNRELGVPLELERIELVRYQSVIS